MSYGSRVNEKRVIGTIDRKKEKSCHSTWLPTTCPTTLTRPP